MQYTPESAIWVERQYADDVKYIFLDNLTSDQKCYCHKQCVCYRMTTTDDDGYLTPRSPSPRRRSLTLESHTNPFHGTSLGKQLELRRQSVSPSECSDQASSPCELTQAMLHSSLAGNLIFYEHKQRRCFVEVSYCLCIDTLSLKILVPNTALGIDH